MTQQTQTTPNEASPDQEAALDALVAEATVREQEFRGVKPPVSPEATSEAEHTGEPEEATEDKPEGEPEDTAPKEAREIAKAAGVDYDALAAKFTEKGSLDTEDYDALAKMGVPKEMVDAYAAGQKALAAQQVDVSEAYAADIHKAVGGADEYTKLTAWAASTMTPDEIAAYDADVLSGDKRRAELAVTALKHRFRAEGGANPKMIQGRTAPSANQGFGSMDEYVAAISDRRYDKDANYRKSVDEKLSRSAL